MSNVSGAAQIRALADEILLEGTFRMEGPISQQGLSIIPIVIADPTEASSDYLNAAQAMKTGALVITEAGDQVETILAHNTGSVPVLIEEGEVLRADGSQDRMVVASLLLQPGEQRRIPVKCVHAPHGLRAGAGYSSMGAASHRMRGSVKRQRYESIMTDVDHYTPEHAVDQGEIWGDVEHYCGVAGSSDRTKYTDSLEKQREKVREAAEKLRALLPEGTCGIIAIDSKGNVRAIEIYRSSQAFLSRAGLIESLLLAVLDEGTTPQEKEAAWAKALQILMKLKDISEDEVIVQEGSQNLHLRLEELTGEAITGKTRDDSPEVVLYCSISTTS